MGKFKKFILIIISLIILVIISVFSLRDQIFKFFFRPTETTLEEGLKLSTSKAPIQTSTTTTNTSTVKDWEIVAEKLEIPWEIAFLPNGDLLVTERPGTLKRIGKEGRTYKIEGVNHSGEGGLLGLTMHPQFKDNKWIYLYLTTKSDNGLINRVERYTLGDDRLSERKVILNNIPGASNHDGGRIAFGPSSENGNYLYVTAGDAGKTELAQNTKSLDGKILRIKDDGSIPKDNPFKNEVWSYGHRNVQGITWDNLGRMWATEHGPSGAESGHDELNLIESGKNYGWPTIRGAESKEGMVSPIVQSGANETWAPAGIAYYNNSLFFAGLRGESIYEAKLLEGNKVSLKSHLRKEFGRIRAVVLGPDNLLYITTSNTDGRGSFDPNDDKIIRINPKLF